METSPPTHTAEPPVRRFWWLKRLSLAGLTLLVLLAITWVVWDQYSRRELQALIDIVLHQGRVVGDDPFLVSRLVGGGIEALAIHRLEIMAGDLRIAQETTSGQLAGEVSREEIRSLIADLLGGRQDAQSMAQAMRAERVFVLDCFDTIFGPSLLLKPAFRLDTARSLDRDTEMAKACALPTLPAARAAIRPPTLMELHLRNQPSAMIFNLGTTPAQPVDPALQTRVLTSTIPSVNLLRFPYRYVCEQRMAAVMLAIRIYVIDSGRYPQTLQELVPKYLATMPADPMADDGRPFGFISADGKRPILYSVGEDGVDQTKGREVQLPAHLLKGWQSIKNGQADDQYRDLSSWVNPEPRPPMTDKLTDEELGLKTQPDDADHADAPGDKAPGDDKGDEARQADHNANHD